MTLQQWQSNGWLKTEPASQQEIENLLAIADRDLEDGKGNISADWRFGIGYNAALKLCTVLLRAEGYRASHGLQHYRTIMALPLILGNSRREDAEYLDSCRIKRNTVEYDFVGGATEGDADELLCFTRTLRNEVSDWLQNNHPELLNA